MTKGYAAVKRPLPVYPEVQAVSYLPYLLLILCVVTEIGRCCKCSGNEQCLIYCRQLTLPHPLTCLHMQEVIVESFIAGLSRMEALRRIAKIS